MNPVRIKGNRRVTPEHFLGQRQVMATTQTIRKLIENPIGRGRVYKGNRFVTEVNYFLQVFHTELNADNPAKPLVTGTISRIDKTNFVWSTELLTLHMQDHRKLDFLCVNYDPECQIASDGGFYS
jgi:hypothetical protein